MSEKNIIQPVRWLDDTGRIFVSPGAAADIPGMVDIIDQTKLPHRLERLHLTDVTAVCGAIQRLSVRGAPAIGCAAALGLAACAQRFRTADPEEFLAQLHRTADTIAAERPTAVNLAWAIRRTVAAVRPGTIREMQQCLLDEALTILADDRARCAAIGQHGMSLLKPGMGVLTHCNAGALATGGCGTALAPIYTAWQAGCALHVFSDETRPLLQGSRLTAWELTAAGIPVTTICDSMAAQVMREGKIQLVIVGADRVAANGDTANKIGTYQLAIAARYHRIPFYVALPESTIDRTIPTGDAIPIEQRPADEIAHCPGAAIYNPAFDVTPHKLITGFITENGIFSAIP